MSGERKGIVYCCCNRADDLTCDRCPRYKKLKPTHTVEVPSWPRKITTFGRN
jgi:hypothetical protein